MTGGPEHLLRGWFSGRETDGPIGGLKAGMGRSAFALMAAVLVLTGLGTIVILRKVDNLSNPYFPDTMLEHEDRTYRPRAGTGPVLVDYIEEDWYPGVWRDLREPSLYLQSRRPSGEILKTVRFTWLRSFHPVIMIRLDWLSPGEVRMTAKRSTGLGGYGAGEIDAELTRSLTQSEVDELRTVMASTHAFSGPSESFHRGGLDGAQWLFEYSAPGLFHFEKEWSAEGPRRQAGLFLLSLTGWSIDPIY